MQRLVEDNPLLLMEAAILEQLRRNSGIALHRDLLNAPLVYDENGRRELTLLYQRYGAVALSAGLPFLMCTPTWRANRQRVAASGLASGINGDAVRFMRALRDSRFPPDGRIMIGGMIGCRHDCYRPDQGLSCSESAHFHAWQVNQLADAGVDFLIAETLPNVNEARGIAQAMGRTAVPYIISFVIDRHGRVLDGTSLPDAVASIDAAISPPPLGYMVNCAYPSFLCAEQQPATLFQRLIGYQANASSLDHCDLDSASELQADDVAVWGREMRKLNRDYGMRIMGGCCGTGVEHLRILAAG